MAADSWAKMRTRAASARKKDFAQESAAIKCYTTPSSDPCVKAGACASAVLDTTDQSDKDQCSAFYLDCATASKKDKNTNYGAFLCDSNSLTTGVYYSYYASKKSDTFGSQYTDTTGMSLRSCTTDACNNPATFNPNAAATALLSAAFMAAAVIFA